MLGTSAKGTVINYLDELEEEAIEAVGGYPIVIKPWWNHGGASPLISDPGQRQS